MKKVVFILGFIFSQFSMASDINNTKITALLSGEAYGNIVFLKISPKPSGTPTCQTNPIYNYAFDPTTEFGKVTLSMALAAYAAGKNVYLSGYNSCGLSSSVGVEQLNQIRVQ